MKKILIVIVLMLLAGAGVWLILNRTSAKTYTSEKLGVSFEYPAGYLINEVDASTGQRNRYSIVLIEDTPSNRDFIAGKMLNTDAPPTITISIYQNNLDHYTLEGFVKSTSFSNFKLSDDKLNETMVAGEPALHYRATGLWENENVVVARPDFVYMFTVFFANPSDKITSDFETILQSVLFH